LDLTKKIKEIKMAFCVSCGTRLDDGARFCANCGVKVSFDLPGAVDTKLPAQSPVSGNQEPANAGMVLLEYSLNSYSFHVIDNDGKTLSAADMFKKTYTATAVAAAVIGIGAGLTAIQWSIKVQVYKTGIWFTKLNMLGRPTENRIMLNGNEIAVVMKTNKNEITINTYSRGVFVFETPRKNRDTAAYLIQEMIDRNGH
jgi:hypothetical protein